MRASLVLGLALSLMIAPVAVASEHGGERGEDDREDRDARADEDLPGDAPGGSGAEERRVKVVVDGTRASLTYERETNAAEDELSFTYQADEGVVKIEYSRETGSAEDEHELKVRVKEVLEYEDVDGDGRYTPERDRVVSSYKTELQDWSVTGPIDVTAPDGTPGTRILGTAPFEKGGNGTLTLVFTAFGSFVDLGAVDIRPTDLKFDIVIDRYPFVEAHTSLAVLTITKHETEYEERETAGESGVAAVAADGLSLYFTWADVATVDGVERAVRSTIVKAEDETEDGKTESKRVVYLSYPRGERIVHDPVVGVSSHGAAPPQEKATPGPSALVALASVAAAAALVAGARRRR